MNLFFFQECTIEEQIFDVTDKIQTIRIGRKLKIVISNSESPGAGLLYFGVDGIKGLKINRCIFRLTNFQP